MGVASSLPAGVEVYPEPGCPTQLLSDRLQQDSQSLCPNLQLTIIDTHGIIRKISALYNFLLKCCHYIQTHITFENMPVHAAYLQWNPSIAATVGEWHFGCYTEVAVVEG